MYCKLDWTKAQEVGISLGIEKIDDGLCLLPVLIYSESRDESITFHIMTVPSELAEMIAFSTGL